MSQNPSTPEDFMRRAIEISRTEMANGAAPFAAVVVKDGRIVGEGVNRVVALSDPTSHGEVEAVRDACRNLGTWDLSGCELYTTCEMCVATLFWARIGKVWYANLLSDAEAVGFDLAPLRDLVRNDPPDRAVPYVPLLREEALPVLEAWTKTPGFFRFS